MVKCHSLSPVTQFSDMVSRIPDSNGVWIRMRDPKVGIVLTAYGFVLFIVVSSSSVSTLVLPSSLYSHSTRSSKLEVIAVCTGKTGTQTTASTFFCNCWHGVSPGLFHRKSQSCCYEKIALFCPSFSTSNLKRIPVKLRKHDKGKITLAEAHSWSHSNKLRSFIVGVWFSRLVDVICERLNTKR